ncbi:hypothetical protein, partial [Streptomyces sp. SID3343]|uniref:hypothetical protein n=1 Tax=Streptomyces sp. SID3343 TaxID=2690260 RepID=UPI00136E439E
SAPPVTVPVPAGASAHASVEDGLVPAALSAHQRLVGRSHLQFLNTRHDNHQLFLEVQQQATRTLLGVAAAFR